jgi:hypothetical protein
MATKARYLSLIFLALLGHFLFGQSAEKPSSSWLTRADTINETRKNLVVYGGGGLGVASLSGLYVMWYSGYTQSGFHFYNDNDNWLQMDKFGHMMTAYAVGELSADALAWSGMREKQAIWYGGLTGLAYLTVVEIMDGFSDAWGFSTGDMLANMAGTGLYLGQQLTWGEQKIRMKYSFHRSDYADLRPNVLGDSWLTSALKDYNGQTYWLSVSPGSFNNGGAFPPWLCVSVGHSGDGMLTGSPNPQFLATNNLEHIARQRQLYLSLDIDLRRIPVKSPWLRTLFNTINFIKIPAPTLGWGAVSGWEWHWMYF